jgi:outer membrane receptor protein involved in Fe transport
MLGGDWQYTTSGQIGTGSLAADERRESVFTRVSYEVAPSVEVFGEFSYASYDGLSGYLNPPDRGRTIFADNAFLPDEVAQQMATLGLESFTMGTSNIDVPPSGNNNQRDTSRLLVGANGEFQAAGKSWAWDAYLQTSMTDTDEHQLPTFHLESLSLATDAVLDPNTGEIVCRSTLSDPTNGCVPMNRFGIGVASQEALDYVLGRPRRQQEFEQQVAAVNFSTNDFSGWAGPISFAAGTEYRKDSVTGSVEEQYISGWQYGNYQVTEGENDVIEAYVETLIPLIDGLDFNGAVRHTDYSSSGGVETWKAGLVYSPIDALTLRITKSKDIRAPNLGELYAAGTARTNSVAIEGESVDFVQNLQGNPTVAPEEADTLGVGIVFRPPFAPGLTAAIDYYEIEVDGVIDFLDAQVITDYCYVFEIDSYCDNLIFVDDELSTINIFYENLNSLKAKGVDYEASYVVDDVGPGTLSLRLMATNYIDNITDDGVNAFDSVGMNTDDTPEWVYRFTARYSMNAWMFNLTARGVSDGVFHNQYIECTSNCPESVAPNFTINENDISGETFFDAYVSRNFDFGGSDAEIFLSVKNLLDTDPPLIRTPSSQGSVSRPGFVPTNRGLYDVMGRNFRLGFRARF